MKTKTKNDFLNDFIKAISAGIIVAISASSYLVIKDEIVGTILFTLGLFVIYTLNFNLFTGKIGFLLQDKNPLQLVIIWFGNLAGVLATTLCMLNTRLASTTQLIEKATAKVGTKLNDSLLSMFILACFCGMIMYIVAKSYKLTYNTNNAVGGYISMFLCVPTFLYLGFEHSIANMFYFSVAEMWSISAVINLLVVTLGNAVGAILISAFSLVLKNKN